MFFAKAWKPYLSLTDQDVKYSAGLCCLAWWPLRSRGQLRYWDSCWTPAASNFQPHIPGLQVFAIGTVPERLELATALEAIPADGRDKQRVVTAIEEATEGLRADAMLEAVGA